MTTYFLPSQRRMIGFLFPLLILGMAAVAAPTFIQAGLVWWPLFIFGLPLLLAIVICVEYWNSSVTLDEAGLRYRSVGYELPATWAQVSIRENGGKTTLVVSQAEPRLYPWLAPMSGVLSLLMPGRTRHAGGLMRSIPLWYFATAPDDAVMVDFHRRTAAQSSGDGGV